MADHDVGAAGCVLRRHLPDEAATAALGGALAGALGSGDTVLLSGPLGAGKSALARALIRAALGDPEADVPSPSYTLVNVFARPGSPGGEIWHADLYRLTGADETLEVGLDEAFRSALTLVEWPDRLGGLRPARRVEIVLAMAGVDARDAEIRLIGPGWERLRSALGLQ